MLDGQLDYLVPKGECHAGIPWVSRQARNARTSSPGARRNSAGVARTSSRPSCSRAMRVATSSASRTSCVTKIAVLPISRRSARNWRCSSTRVTGSSAPNGSSNSRSGGGGAPAPGGAPPPHFARARQEQRVDHLQRRGLAGAAASQEQEGLPGLDVQAQLAQDVFPAEPAGDVPERHEGGHEGAAGAAAIQRFSAKGHSPSTHCPSHTKPVRAPMPGISSTRYLWQASVQIVSPFSNVQVKPASRIVTDCFRNERRCISMRRSLLSYLASCTKCRSAKSPPSSRLMRARRFRLNAAVTPVGSS